MTEQLGLDGMPAKLYACTPSKLSAWWDCPRRFRFSYLDRPSPPKGPPWAHHSIGVSAHNALRDFWLLPVQRRTAEQAGSLVQRAWIGLGFRDDAQERAARGAVTDMVRRYLDTVDGTDEPIGVERGVATTTARLAVRGRVDRIDLRPREDADGEELVVVDYKTGRWPLTVDDTRGSMALALYAVASARTLRRHCAKVELHHLPTGDVLAHRHTPEALERHVSRAEAVADEARAAEVAYAAGDMESAFPPAPGRQCGTCDFRASCPEGAAAAPHRQPWDTLDPALG